MVAVVVYGYGSVWYMDTDSERWRISNGGRWHGDDDGAAAA